MGKRHMMYHFHVRENYGAFAIFDLFNVVVQIIYLFALLLLSCKGISSSRQLVSVTLPTSILDD